MTKTKLFAGAVASALIIIGCSAHKPEPFASRAEATFATRAYSTNRPGTIGGSGSVNTNPPGVITPPGSDSTARSMVLVDTNGNITSPANLQLPAFSLFSTQAVMTLVPIPNTNTLYLRGAGVSGANGTWTFNTTMGKYTSSPPSALESIFIDTSGKAVITNSGSTNLYSKSGGFAGQYAISPGDGTPLAPWASFATNGFSTNYTLAERSAVDSYNIFGITFDGGEGFPPNINQVQGRYVWSRDGERWAGGTGGKQLIGITGNLRDPALLDLGNRYALSYTTTVSNTAPYGFSNCTTVPLLVSTNLNHWTFITNTDFAMAGESLVLASNWCWSPVFSSDGSNLWLHASVSTNNANSFEIRYRKTTLANYPFGLSATERLTNSNPTVLTNLIDLTPFYDAASGRWYAWYKNETTKYVELGIFNSDPGSLFTPVLTGDHSGWSSSVEGNWMVRLPNGNYRVFMNRYQGKSYGNGGQGEQLCYADSASIASGWSTLKHCLTPFNFQSFKPIIVRSASAQTHAQAATLSGMQLVGRMNLIPEMTSPQGLYGMGYAFTNPFPNDYYTGVDTNSFTGWNFGEGNWGSGVYGKGDGTVRLFARTFNSADGNAMNLANAKDVLIGISNRLHLTVGLVAPGTAFTVADVNQMLTNGQTWSGMMSNAFQIAGKSNNVTTWKIIWP